MTPKFRGGSDEWIDDQKSSSGKSASRPKKEIRATGIDLPWEESNGIVVEVFPKQCRIRLPDQSELLCSYRWARLLGKGAPKNEVRARAPVAVGDRVKIEQSSPDSGVVVGLCKRRNSLARVAPGRDNASLHHVIAANVDRVVVVSSLYNPEFSPGLVDRYIVACAAAGIPVSLCLTKTDLAGGDLVREAACIYKVIGIPIFPISSKTGEGIEALNQALKENEVVFCGHSGVGKTSLLNALGARIGSVSDVNEFTGKGKHTTTSAVMIESPDKNRHWIDTPGVREFSLAGIPLEDLRRYFPEFSSLECARVRGCLHLGEPLCNAEELARYPSYRRIYDSVHESLHGSR